MSGIDSATSTSSPATTAPVTALLLLATHCPHCKTVLLALTDLLKEGQLGELRAINLDQQPEAAAAYQVRSVPWCKIGPFQLSGARSKAELQQWINKAGSLQGMADYFAELMAERQVDAVITLLREEPAQFEAILQLLSDPETTLAARIGIGVIMEEFATSPMLQQRLAALGALTSHADARVRGDSCHYLALSGDKSVLPWLQTCLNDPSADVREAAADGIGTLADAV